MKDIYFPETEEETHSSLGDGVLIADDRCDRVKGRFHP